MADEVEKSNHKHHHDEAETKTITNIYYDCLERIFDHLDLVSLLNVAGTCKRLQIAAAAKFGDHFGDKHVFLYPSHSTDVNIEIEPEFDVGVYGMEFFLPFLRCFGAKISKLYIEYNGAVSDAQNDHLDQYINEYCADTLTTIKFETKCEFSIGNFSKPFKNVSDVSIYWVDLGNQLPHFVNWFPNMRRLTMQSFIIDDIDMAITFPYLEDLHIEINDRDENSLTIENAAILLRANRQLKSLQIGLGSMIGLEKAMSLIRSNPFITEFIIYRMNFDANIVESNLLTGEYPSMIEDLSLGCYELLADVAIKFVHQLKSLKYFRFRINGRSEYDRFLSQLDNKWECHADSRDFDTIFLFRC